MWLWSLVDEDINLILADDTKLNKKSWKKRCQKKLKKLKKMKKVDKKLNKIETKLETEIKMDPEGQRRALKWWEFFIS